METFCTDDQADGVVEAGAGRVGDDDGDARSARRGDQLPPGTKRPSVKRNPAERAASDPSACERAFLAYLSFIVSAGQYDRQRDLVVVLEVELAVQAD